MRLKRSIMKEVEKRKERNRKEGRGKMKESEVRKREKRRIMAKGHVFILFHFLQRPKKH